MVNALDPVECDAEIAHLSFEVQIPHVLGHAAYLVGFARSLGSPRIAERIWRDGTGDQGRIPYRRDEDTLVFFSEFMRRGHRTRAGADGFERARQVHKDVGGVLNEDMIYVHGMLVLDAARVARELGSDYFTDNQLDGMFNFWTGVARGMGLRGLPETRRELAAYVVDYERRHMRPAEVNRLATEGVFRGFERWFPDRFKPLSRHILATAMGGEQRYWLQVESPPRGVERLVRQAWRMFVSTNGVRPVRLDRTFATTFNRTGGLPHLDRLGYRPSTRPDKGRRTNIRSLGDPHRS